MIPRSPLRSALALGCALAATQSGPGAAEAPQERYCLLLAEDAARLEQRLQDAAAEGYVLTAAAEGIDVSGQPRIAALLERGGGDRMEYRVLSCAGLDDEAGRLAELGAGGFRLAAITARELGEFWLPETTYDDQLTLILERDGTAGPHAFATLPFGSYEPFYERLSRLRAEGHEVVGLWNTGRKLELVLQRRIDDGTSPAEPREHRLLLLATRTVLAGRLEAAAGDGFRVLAAADPSTTGPPVMLLEKSAVAGDVVDYRFLDDVPVKQTRDALVRKLNKRARKGWRLSRRGTTAEVITLERPARKSARTTKAEYRMLSSRRAPGIAEALARAVDEGFEPVGLFVEPEETTVLVERLQR